MSDFSTSEDLAQSIKPGLATKKLPKEDHAT
jgi:hypothetical protein